MVASVVRAIDSLRPQVDKSISDHEEIFKKLQNNFKSSMTLDTAIQVHTILDAVQNIGMFE